LPVAEIFLMIKIGGQIGAINTILLIFFTAIVGIYFVKSQGMKTIRAGVTNLIQHRMPIYEILSGASIAIAALLLIIPGFFTDAIGFILLIPLSRKILINLLIKKRNIEPKTKSNKTLDGEIIEDKKDEL